jgi:amino acid adenylation domain-containing protein
MIPKDLIEDLYPLSPLQEAMAVEGLRNPNGRSYLQQVSFTLTGELDFSLFEQSWAHLIARHTILRTVFILENTPRFLQAVLRHSAANIRSVDISALPPEQHGARLAQQSEADLLRGFQLGDRPPSRLLIIKTGPNTHEVTWTHHHILLDGWCLGALAEELFTIYADLVAGAKPTLPPARPYADFIRWIVAQPADAALDHWRGVLGHVSVNSRLPRGDTHGTADALIEVHQALPSAQRASLLDLARHLRATPSSLLHAAWGVFIAKYSGERASLFSSIVANRPQSLLGVERMMGLFINAVPVHVSAAPEASFGELVQAMQAQTLARADHEFLPLAQIIGAMPHVATAFDSLLIVQNYPLGQVGTGKTDEPLGVHVRDFKEQAHAPLTLTATVEKDIGFHFAALPEEYDPAMVNQIAEGFVDFLNRVIAASDEPIANIGLLDVDASSHATRVLPPTEPALSVPESFAAQVAATPNAPALQNGSEILNYSQLADQVANLVAIFYDQFGLRAGQRVGVQLPRDASLVTALLALARIGVAYVPIGLTDPTERQAYIMLDSDIEYVLCARQPGTLPDGVRAIVLGTSLKLRAQGPSCPAPQSQDTLYVAYTSGSTGRPKGVEISQANMTAFSANLTERFGLKLGQRILGLTTHTFDISGLELICSLLNGLCVVLADDETAADPALIRDLIIDAKIDVVQATPSRLRSLLDVDGASALSQTQTILVGGETLPIGLADTLKTLGPRVFNVYGPTETTIWSTAHDLDDGPLCIGLPLNGETVFGIDSDGNILPAGVQGELCIAGTGVGLGYHARADLNAERYPPQPHDPTKRMYRTGDLGHRRLDGRFVLSGRSDDQVKLRGHRIELGEIAAILSAQTGVRNSAVLVQNDSEGVPNALTGYVEADASVLPEQMLGQLSTQLPVYMLPSQIVRLSEFPLLTSGKIDRHALRQVNASETIKLQNAEGEPPKDSVEIAIASIFAEILNGPVPSRHADFFALGGHSLLAAKLTGRLRKDFGCTIAMRDLFDSPSVAAIATHVRARGGQAEAIRIPKRDDADDYPLSPAQMRLFVLDQISGGGPDYIISMQYDLFGHLNLDALQSALDGLMERHEALRTAFIETSKGPRQRVLPAVAFDLRRAEADTDGASLRSFVLEPFKLSNGYLARAIVVQVDQAQTVFAFCLHHIVGDALSLAIIARDLTHLYNANVNGTAPKLKPLTLQLRDIATWQSERAVLASYGDTWKNSFTGPLPVLEVPLAQHRPSTASPKAARHLVTLDDATATKLRRLASTGGTGLFTLLSALTAMTLARWSRQDDIILGTAAANRDLTELEPQIGPYINTVPFRLTMADDATPHKILAYAKVQVRDALDRRHLPFEDIVAALDLPRDPSRTPLVEVMVGYRPAEASTIALTGIKKMISRDPAALTARFDLSFDLVESTDGVLQLEVLYRDGLFSPAAVAGMTDSWQILANALNNQFSDTPLHRIPLLSSSETEIVHGPIRPQSQDDTLVSMFAAQVARTPDAIAVVEGVQQLSYRALDARVTALSSTLVSKQNGHAGLVGLFLSRSLDAVIAILAIQRAGAAYVALDQEHPNERLKAIFSQAACTQFICQSEDMDRLTTLTDAQLVDVKYPNQHGAALPKVKSSDLAYVLFTSGTTGTPKGVMIEHGSVVNLIQWMNRTVHGGPTAIASRHAAVSALTFDVSVHETFAALLFGHTLHIVPDHVKTDPVGHGKLIREAAITSLSLTPSLLNLLVECGGITPDFPVETLLLGAEVLSSELVEKTRRAAANPQLRVFNLYGPSEICVEATAYEVPSDTKHGPSPIGLPIDNCEITICDAALNPLPREARGEICIAGPGLARAYLGAPDLTARSFVTSPTLGSKRVYRTGDLGFLRADGLLMFEGRQDTQVKLRGYRIELAEVETCLVSHPDVTAAVAHVTHDTLVAYVVTNVPVTASELRTYLGCQLPAYMLPEHIVNLDNLPMSKAGKIDRRSLPAPSIPTTIASADLPKTRTEQLVARHWQAATGTSPRRDADFFLSGGHSIAAIRLLSALASDTGRTVPLAKFLRNPKLAALAAAFEDADLQDPEIQPAPIAADYPLSRAQKRLWVVEEIDPTAYLLMKGFKIDGPLDTARLRDACKAVTQRHDSLTTRFVTIDGRPRQIPRSAPFSFTLHAPQTNSDTLKALQARSRQAFTLSDKAPIRFDLWPLAEGGHMFLMGMHHIAGDGQSLDLIFRGIATAYQDGTQALPPMRLQAHDVAVHEQMRLADPKDSLAESKRFWHKQLSAPVAPLELPSDRPRPLIKTTRGKIAPFTFSNALSRDLLAAGQSGDGGVFPLLVALVNTLFHRLTGQSDICIGTAITTRTRAELADQVGFHVATVVLRSQIDSTSSFSTVWKGCAQTVRDAIDHATYPIDALLAELDLPHDTSRSGLFDAMVIYHVADNQNIELPELVITPLATQENISRFDLSLHFTRFGDRLGGGIEYNSDLFDADRIDRMIAALETLARAALGSDKTTPISTLDLVGTNEKALLKTFEEGPSRPISRLNMPELVKQQAERYPQNIAIAGSMRSLSYAQLMSEADALATQLKDAGVRSGEAIAVCMERDTDLVVAMLSILQAGAVYLPLEPDHPTARLERIVSSAGARFALIDATGRTALAENVKETYGLTPEIDLANLTTSQTSSLHPNTAYLIFTSGTTGEPKGVRLGHAGFVNMITEQIDQFGITSDDRVALFASAAFDASLSEMFMALACGACLCPLRSEITLDGPRFIDSIQASAITAITLPPAYLSALGQPKFPTLKVLITAGEAPVAEDVAYYTQNLNYFNAYGPTENSVCSTIQRILPKNTAPYPIGKPLPNTSVQILDDDLQPVPIGVEGEICLAGSGLALGYVDPMQTLLCTGPNGDFYRSGDRGRWLADGTILYAGRRDTQVKVRGQRIELGEVNAGLEAHPSIRQARSGLQLGILVAHVLSTDEALSEVALRRWISQTLTPAMVPARIVLLNAWPLTPSGKIDIARLPTPAVSTPTLEISPPQGHHESTVAAILGRALGRPVEDRSADIFALGIDSLNIVMIATELRNAGYTITVTELYRNKTIAEIATLIAEAKTALIVQRTTQGVAPLTAIQRWYFSRYTGNRDHFNQSVLLDLPSGIDATRLKAALKDLMERHPALSVVFQRSEEREWVQSYGSMQSVDIIYATDETAAECAETLQRSLDIETGRLVGAALITRADGTQALLLVLHHLAVDGISWRILLTDFEKLLKKKSLPIAFGSTPADLALAEARIMDHTALQRERPMWKLQLQNLVPAPWSKLPALPVSEQITVTTRLTYEKTKALQTSFNAGLEDILLAAFSRAIKVHFDIHDLVVMVEGHGRDAPTSDLSLQGSVGWHTTIYPIILRDVPKLGTDAISHIRKARLAVPNGGIGFLRLMMSEHGQDLSIATASAAGFNYLGEIGNAETASDGLSVIGSLGDQIDPKADAFHPIDLLASIQNGQLELRLTIAPNVAAEHSTQTILDAIQSALVTFTGTQSDSSSAARPVPYDAPQPHAPALMSSGNGPDLFAMPPLLGFSSAFRGLGSHLNTLGLYAFDFIEDHARLDLYADAITAQTGTEPIRIMGHSAGALLGFELAKHLEKMGHEVAQLILVDAPCKPEITIQSDAEIDKTIHQDLAYFKDRMRSEGGIYGEAVSNPILLDEIKRKMRFYIKTLDALSTEGCISADIFQVRSDQVWSKPNQWSNWAHHTSGTLHTLQGFGRHADMFNAINSKSNAQVLEKLMAAH